MCLASSKHVETFPATKKHIYIFFPFDLEDVFIHSIGEFEFKRAAKTTCQTIFPDPDQLFEVLERLYRGSISPNGKFGFHLPTFNGIVPLINDWGNMWEEDFSRPASI